VSQGATSNTAESELEKVSRKARRMFTRKKFRKPDAKKRPYRMPAKVFRTNGVVDVCHFCGRPTAFGSRRCRECYQKQVRAKYEAKVRAEEERVSANERAYLNATKRKGTAMAKAKKLQLPNTPINRSTSGLRTALFEEMEALRSGASDAQRARSIAMMANSILQSVQVEIEYHKYVSANKGKIEGQQKVVQLGTDISLAA
jgi:hypothetical protein